MGWNTIPFLQKVTSLKLWKEENRNQKKLYNKTQNPCLHILESIQILRITCLWKKTAETQMQIHLTNIRKNES